MSKLLDIWPPCGCFQGESMPPLQVRSSDFHDEFRWLPCDRCGAEYGVRVLVRSGGKAEPEIHVRSRRSA